jgi:HEPN domain-containing protein
MAQHDLSQAEDAFANSKYSDVVMYAQQSSEKVAKALLELEKHFESIHDVSDIFYVVIMKNKKYEPYENEFQIVRKYLRWLAFHWGKSRYPILEGGVVVSPLDRYDKDFAKDALEKAKFIYETLLKALREIHYISI